MNRDRAWSSDFSYAYFRQILGTASAVFDIHRLRDAPSSLDRDGRRPGLFLRHDVDLNLSRALRMAEIEAEQGIGATFMVMAHSSLYRIEDFSSKQAVRELIAMGHEVSLHFDFDAPEDRGGSPDLAGAESRIVEAARRLEQVTSSPVASLSFHRPLEAFLRGPLRVGSMINAYAAALMGWYMSDSRGRWRDGEPLPRLIEPEGPLLQLLIHPVWWGDAHRAAEDRLQDFFESATSGMGEDRVAAFDRALRGHLTIARRGLAATDNEMPECRS